MLDTKESYWHTLTCTHTYTHTHTHTYKMVKILSSVTLKLLKIM